MSSYRNTSDSNQSWPLVISLRPCLSFKGIFMRSLIYSFLIALCISLAINACVSKPSQPNPTGVLPTPTVMPSPTPVAVVDSHCSSVGASIQCEAFMSYELKSCRTADNSDWAPMYFKDAAELDAYGKAHTIAFYYPDTDHVVGTTQSVFPFHCQARL